MPYAMAIAAARGSSWSFLGRVFGHFFDLGCHRGRFEKGISIFWSFEKIAFFGGFLGVLDAQVLVMVFWKGCYRVDVLCGYTCGGWFCFGVFFWGSGEPGT